MIKAGYLGVFNGYMFTKLIAIPQQEGKIYLEKTGWDKNYGSHSLEIDVELKEGLLFGCDSAGDKVWVECRIAGERKFIYLCDEIYEKFLFDVQPSKKSIRFLLTVDDNGVKCRDSEGKEAEDVFKNARYSTKLEKNHCFSKTINSKFWVSNKCLFLAEIHHSL